MVGALVHDIGKLVIDEGVLAKPGPLDEEEWRSVRRHPDGVAGFHQIASHGGAHDPGAEDADGQRSHTVIFPGPLLMSAPMGYE